MEPTNIAAITLYLAKQAGKLIEGRSGTKINTYIDRILKKPTIDKAFDQAFREIAPENKSIKKNFLNKLLTDPEVVAVLENTKTGALPQKQLYVDIFTEILPTGDPEDTADKFILALYKGLSKDQEFVNLGNLHSANKIDGIETTVERMEDKIGEPTRHLPPNKTAWNIPKRNEFFTGRQEILNRLQSTLQTDRNVAINQVIHGLGGIGKSQIAIEYAHINKKDYDIAWWIDAETKVTVEAALAELTDSLNLPEKQATEQNIKVRAALDHLNKTPDLLIIFDNVEASDDILPYIPKAGHSIITTRNQNLPGFKQSIPIDTWTDEEAQQFLKTRLDNADENDINALCDVLGKLPLAMELAVAHIVASELSIPEYIQLFKNQEDEVINKYSDFIVIDKSDITPVLGVDVIANELSKLLINMKNEKGMMIGIFGKWGRGKTFLMEQIWKNLDEPPIDNPFYDVTFHAWKYQDTPASWAYLYEKIAEKYYGKSTNVFSRSRLTYLKKLISLNFKRKGWFPIINISIGVLSSILITYFFNHLRNQEVLDIITATLGISLTFVGSFIGIVQYLKKEYSSKAIELFKTYSGKQSFKDFLGIQAEIQKELKVLLENWIPLKEFQKRILLFVDDIDRCSEERIIQIIDSLRVMLEEDGIFQRIIVIVAVDEEVLKRAIKWKYSFYLDGKNESKIDEEINNLIKEYIDKLFLIGIKLGKLTDLEKKEIFDVYTNERDMVVAPPEEYDSKKEPVKTKQPELSPKPEPDKPVGEPSGERETETDEEEYEISYQEYELLRKYIEMLEDATPRKVRILYYRYLLARNLLNRRLRKTEFKKVWEQETDKSVIPKLILNCCNQKNLFSFNEKKSKNTDNNMEIDDKIFQELEKIIELVVAY